MVVENSGLSIEEIWAKGGEGMFRPMEANAVALVPATGCVAAAGGGAILEPANRSIIAVSDSVIWLRCSTGVLARRLEQSHDRPLLDAVGGRLEWLEATLGARRDHYSDLATDVIDTDDLSERQVVNEVLDRWR
jgi:shikimate kinase